MPSNHPFARRPLRPSLAPRRFRIVRAGVASTAVVASAALLLASCGQTAEPTVPVFPVQGMVRFGANVPVGAQVVLHPQGRSLPANLASAGTVGPDGTFKIGTYDRGDGAPAGEYRVTLQWFKIVATAAGSGRGPNVLPREYADPLKTPLLVTVRPQDNTLDPIQIKR